MMYPDMKRAPGYPIPASTSRAAGSTISGSISSCSVTWIIEPWKRVRSFCASGRPSAAPSANARTRSISSHGAAPGTWQ